MNCVHLFECDYIPLLFIYLLVAFNSSDSRCGFGHNLLSHKTECESYHSFFAGDWSFCLWFFRSDLPNSLLRNYSCDCTHWQFQMWFYPFTILGMFSFIIWDVAYHFLLGRQFALHVFYSFTSWIVIYPLAFSTTSYPSFFRSGVFVTYSMWITLHELARECRIILNFPTSNHHL